MLLHIHAQQLRIDICNTHIALDHLPKLIMCPKPPYQEAETLANASPSAQHDSPASGVNEAKLPDQEVGRLQLLGLLEGVLRDAHCQVAQGAPPGQHSMLPTMLEGCLKRHFWSASGQQHTWHLCLLSCTFATWLQVCMLHMGQMIAPAAHHNGASCKAAWTPQQVHGGKSTVLAHPTSPTGGLQALTCQPQEWFRCPAAGRPGGWRSASCRGRM